MSKRQRIASFFLFLFVVLPMIQACDKKEEAKTAPPAPVAQTPQPASAPVPAAKAPQPAASGSRSRCTRGANRAGESRARDLRRRDPWSARRGSGA